MNEVIEIQNPTAPSEISLDWLNKRLGAAGIPRIASFRIEPVEAGFYGSLARIDVWYEAPGTGPPAFFAKFAAEDRSVRESLRPLAIYEREYNFYTTLAAHSPVRVPKCYFAFYEPESQDTLLLLEQIEGDVFDDLTGATARQAEIVFDQAAQFHKHWLGHPVLEEDWVQPLGGPPILEGFAAATAEAAAEGAGIIGDSCPKWMLNNIDRVFDIIRGQLVEINRLPHTLIHYDFRLANMIFSGKEGSESLTLIDWQAALRAPGVCDLGSFAAYGLTVSDRRDWEGELVGRYLFATEGWAGKNWPGWFEDAYGRTNLVAAYNCLRNATVLEMNDPPTKALLHAWIERTCAIAEDHNAIRFLNE